MSSRSIEPCVIVAPYSKPTLLEIVPDTTSLTCALLVNRSSTRHNNSSHPMNSSRTKSFTARSFRCTFQKKPNQPVLHHSTYCLSGYQVLDT